MNLKRRGMIFSALKIVLTVVTVQLICSLSVADGGACFRKFSPERNACKGLMAREYSSDEFDLCCSKRGQGYAQELKRIGKGKKWFECLPCSSTKWKDSDPVMMSQISSQELQVDEPAPPSPAAAEKADHLGKETDVWAQKRKESKGKREKKLLEKNNHAKEFVLEENSFKHDAVKDADKVQMKIRDKDEDDEEEQEQDRDVWSPWSDWGPCSKTCGDGLHQRTRFCLKSSCKDEDFQERPCPDLKPCAVDGHWSNWSNWSGCNVSCGSGYEERTRTCTHPASSNGGKECQGSRTEARQCKTDLPCPIDGGWSNWSNWTTCSATCGEGFQTRSRQCNNPLPQHGGKACEGIELESMPCVTRINCAVDGNWTEWSRMDICSAKPCSGQSGYRTRFRSCINPRPMFGGKPCKGRSWMRELCYNNEFCTEKVDGGWCNWNNWSDCSMGIKKRLRNCECPPPANDGTHCEGDSSEEKACDEILEGQQQQQQLQQQAESSVTVKTSGSVTRREGCYDNEGSGDGSDIGCDQELEEPATTDETGGSGENQQ